MNTPCPKTEALKALRVFQASIVLLRCSTRDEGGLEEALNAYEGTACISTSTTVAHYMLALNAMDTAKLHLANAMLALGENQ
jgi:hypothetical protein